MRFLIGAVMNSVQKNKQWLLKSGVLALSVGILSACQTMSLQGKDSAGDIDPNQPTKEQVIKPFSKQDFSRASDFQAKSAKQKLTGAMSALLNSERTAMTEYYYQAEPTEQKGSLNAGSDSLFTTILKMFDYSKSEETPETELTKPFRTMADFTPLGESDKPLLYLRYYDEVEGTTPAKDYNLSRLDGMSERMQATDAVVYQLNKGYQACVQSFSYEMDGLVDANPAITSDDKAVKSALATFDDCTKEQDIIANRLRTKEISAYHRQDMAMGHICASNYRRSLVDALSAKRTQKRYDKKDGSYDAYDSVYAQYGICHSVFMNGYRSDPVVYMNNGDTKWRLEGLKEARACGLEFTDGVATLYQAGMSYRTHAKEHQGLVYAHMDCLMDSAEKVYNEEGDHSAKLQTYETPTNRFEMAKALKMYQEIASEGRTTPSLSSETEAKSRVGGMFDKYFSMKKEELAKESKGEQSAEPKLDGLGGNVYQRVAGEMIKSFKQTPAQISAQNYYAYNNTKVTVLSYHNPRTYRADVLMSLDFESPTAVQSVQVPFSQDFKRAKMAMNVGAGLPIMSALAPAQTPLAKDFKDEVGVVNFALPPELQEIIPLNVVYDSAIKGFVAGLGELHDSNFSAVDIKDDSFAKRQGASYAVKVNLNLQQAGELLAFVSKQVVRDLSQYVDKHPELYAQKPTENLGVADSIATQKANERKQKLKTAIEKWALLDKGFVSSDVGGLFQVIDGILPINYYQSNYYYFNHQGRLVGQLVRQDLDDNVSKARTRVVAMTSFKATDFHNHHLSKRVMPLVDSFSFDGNGWVREQRRLADLKKEAQNLRYDYNTTNGVLSDPKNQ